MNVTDIPFAHYIGIEQENDTLSLGFHSNVMNHLNTLHASAQFALAETESGMYLQTLFPELARKVVPVLRDAQMKYRQPAVAKIFAVASSDGDAVKKFRMQFGKKGRGLLEVRVEVKDINNTLTSQAIFTWFVQAR